MSDAPDAAGLTIGDVAARTGVSVATLRMWETRYGIPVPHRLPGGHRRYTERDVEIVLAALRARDAGLSLPAALEQAQAAAREAPPVSIYAELRRAQPELRPAVFPKHVLIALSHAIEDECCARAQRPLLIGTFQQERFYRDGQRRWDELARTAELALVFADFPRARRDGPAPREIPIDPSTPMTREWVVVCDAPDYAACLAAWEVPETRALPDPDRRFEAVWSAEPAVVRSAALIGWRLARAALPDLPETLDAFGHPAVEQAGDARRVTALANRMLDYLAP
jgi:DICT domain-containing protein